MTKHLSAKETEKAISKFGIERSLIEAFGYSDEMVRHRYAFHRHTKHQLLSPQAGVVMVETADALHVVSALQAAWIPAGVRHATTIGEAPAYTLFFPAAKFRTPVESLHVLPAGSLLRELLMAGTATRKVPSAVRQSLFTLLHYTCVQALKNPAQPSLPRPRSAALSKAVDQLLQTLETASPASLARHAGVSERTLRRYFRSELALSPERYIQQARLTKAMQLLMDRRHVRSVIDVALEVGYSNHSAFSAAFRKFTGRSPVEFRTGEFSPSAMG
ncbi:helix-turn-helix domain-containing protein [Terrimicrobium sacchariphilum]|uniref:Helix-turn-helix domain-containing protein n=1 Tax=Terrimicrobium sacchariphilum TaxID=690879 RepID=A0A146G4Y8_TERSA|nr:AraC family transcriptional regulator [Terrimicrobium sacchariphilum]GAT31888.1 helix-turn-helix domain-containing protein [Terrimicrobium sacchariphilum]